MVSFIVLKHNRLIFRRNPGRKEMGKIIIGDYMEKTFYLFLERIRQMNFLL